MGGRGSRPDGRSLSRWSTIGRSCTGERWRSRRRLGKNHLQGLKDPQGVIGTRRRARRRSGDDHGANHPRDQDHAIVTRRVDGGDDPQVPQTTTTETRGSGTSLETKEGQEADQGQSQEDRVKGHDLGRGRRGNTRRNVTEVF